MLPFCRCRNLCSGNKHHLQVRYTAQPCRCSQNFRKELAALIYRVEEAEIVSVHLQDLTVSPVEKDHIQSHWTASLQRLNLISPSSLYLRHVHFCINNYPTRCINMQFIYISNCSTCFGRYLHPSSGARITDSTVSGITETGAATCCGRDWMGHDR